MKFFYNSGPGLALFCDKAFTGETPLYEEFLFLLERNNQLS